MTSNDRAPEDYAPADYYAPRLASGVVWADVVADIAAGVPRDDAAVL
jgi:hypothetical protein